MSKLGVSLCALVLFASGCLAELEGDDPLVVSTELEATVSCNGNTPVGSWCMDGVCDPGEDYKNCSQDCGWQAPAPTLRTAQFDAQLYQNGAYDKPIVLIEGFDPADDYTVWNYWSSFTSVTKLPICFFGSLIQPYQAYLKPPLLATFVSRSIAKGYDIWVVSTRKPVDAAADRYTWELGDLYRTTLHPLIRDYAGYRPYVLSGFSAGGLVARKALSGMSAAQRTAEIKAYVSIDTPHEGAYVPNGLQAYMLDHAICGQDSALGLDPQGMNCHTRYVRHGLASKGAVSLLKHRVNHEPGNFYPGWAMPSLWTDCHDAGGCDPPHDTEWRHYNPSIYTGLAEHANYYIESRSPAWFSAQYGWFTDLPRYAISNSSIFQSPGMTHTSEFEILHTDVDTWGDHHLYSDSHIYQPQKRGSLDGFMNRMDNVAVSGARLHKKQSFVFVSYNSAFGVGQGLAWTGRLTGQNLPHDPYVVPNPTVPPTTTLHENLTQDTVDYLTQVIDASLAGGTVPGNQGPASARGDGGCTEGETVFNAPYDCRGYCGDGVCNTSYIAPSVRESCSTCASDCGTCQLPCCGTCFAAGTEIAMADGSRKPIEDVTAGDLVLGRDDGSGALVPQSVIRTITHEDNDSTVVINGSIYTTPEHPFFANGRYVPAGELTVGDQLLELSGVIGTPAEAMAAVPIEVTSLSTLPGLEVTYNFEVAGSSNYFAGGVLVHNKKACRICDEPIF